MSFSMGMKRSFSISNPFSGDEEKIAFHANGDVPAQPVDEDAVALDGKLAEEYENKLTGKEEKTKVGHKGILVIGEAPNARALMAFGAGYKGAISYAETANLYQQELRDIGVQVYVMAIPSAIEYYCPDKAKDVTKPQRETIRGLHDNLKHGVKPVDVYTILGRHAAEPIFLRTDHHWSPLGAYYAAKQFAAVAKVPFIDIKNYTRHVVPGFVGTMYGYSKDIAVKNSPEDFVWYEPKNITYKTSYINYTINKDYEVTSEGKMTEGKYFYDMKGGMAYSTFMGGDTKITHVRIYRKNKNGRRLLIIKDSFGNAIPGYLFGSFDDIHVVDCRYFTKNMKQYCKDNKITDLLFANNTFKCCETSLCGKLKRYLTQGSGSYARKSDEDKAKRNSPKVKKESNKKAENGKENDEENKPGQK